MKHSERFALDHFLSDYPRDLPFDEVIDLLLDETSDAVLVERLVENHPRWSVAELIDELRVHFEHTVDDLVWGVALAELTEEETQAEQEARG